MIILSNSGNSRTNFHNFLYEFSAKRNESDSDDEIGQPQKKRKRIVALDEDSSGNENADSNRMDESGPVKTPKSKVKLLMQTN